ncbi:MAG: orotidine-5'-phosphate decarboxylase [Syntrophobacterales bacterium]|nr:orotidine-5'-phosphate decarboxylase [Syntrophobacterales bacterium]
MRLIPPEERLILALDLPTKDEAIKVVKRVEGYIRFFKVGLQLFLASHFYMVDWLGDKGYKVFLDLKLHDIPNTVIHALNVMSQHPVTFTTLHAEESILRAGVEAVGDRIGILAVTVLTSVDPKYFNWGKSLEEVVIERTGIAIDAGCVGVIASGKEVSLIRKEYGEDPIIVTPGIRSQSTGVRDDQKRTVTAFEAIKNGSDYIVVGRPILNALDPKTVIVEIVKDIEKAMKK